MALLGALLLMMVHNIVPHTHHDHGDSHASFTHSSHHHHEHDKTHEHSDSQNSEDEDNFLFLFFVHHFHSSSTNDFILTAQLEHTISNKQISLPQFSLHSSAISLDHFHLRVETCYTSHERLYNYTYISSGSSRAPPYLG